MIAASGTLAARARALAGYKRCMRTRLAALACLVGACSLDLDRIPVSSPDGGDAGARESAVTRAGREETAEGDGSGGMELTVTGRPSAPAADAAPEAPDADAPRPADPLAPAGKHPAMTSMQSRSFRLRVSMALPGVVNTPMRSDNYRLHTRSQLVSVEKTR
jgi:hypothetical protein